MEFEKKEHIAAVITAAGLSSRMGDFKPLLPFGSGSIARCCVENFRKAGVETIVMVTGHRAEELEAHLAGLDIRFVRNPGYAGNAMFDSVCLGLRALPDSVSRVLITPVDIPAVKAETIQTLLQCSGELVRPVCDGRSGHPVVLSRSAAVKLLSHDGTMGLRGAIAAKNIAVQDVAVDDVGTLYDADTPADYRRLLHILEN